jgi:hypothetical protein
VHPLADDALNLPTGSLEIGQRRFPIRGAGPVDFVAAIGIAAKGDFALFALDAHRLNPLRDHIDDATIRLTAGRIDVSMRRAAMFSGLDEPPRGDQGLAVIAILKRRFEYITTLDVTGNAAKGLGRVTVAQFADEDDDHPTYFA